MQDNKTANELLTSLLRLAGVTAATNMDVRS